MGTSSGSGESSLPTADGTTLCPNGWLVIRTGGVEAAIAMHVLNNYLAFTLALTFGDINETLTVTEVSWWNIPVTLTQSLVYAGLVAWVAGRRGLQRTTRPPQP